LPTGWRCRPNATSVTSSTWCFSRSSRAPRLLQCLVFLQSSMVGCCLSLRRSSTPISIVACDKFWWNGWTKTLQMLHRRSQSSRTLTPPSNSRTSCFLMGECCGRIYWEDVPTPTQAREGPTNIRRRKERQPLKMEGVALQVWKVLEDGRCYTPRLEGA
jgi:hypothetical protein